MGIGMELVGGLIGALLGLAVSYGNMLITKRAVRKRSGDGLNAVMATNLLRQVVNIAALAAVFLLRNVSPLPFTGTLIGTALGLSVGNILFIWLLTKQMERDDPPKGGD